jgi:phage gp36-like protein
MYHGFTDLLTIISREELRQLTDDTSVGSIVETPPNAPMAIINECGRKAGSLIDSYCMGRYALPLSPVPDVIRDFSAELTVYNCMMRKKEIALSEEQNRRYKIIISFLEHIQDGRVKLFGDVQAPPSISVGTPERVFTEEKLDQF